MWTNPNGPNWHTHFIHGHSDHMSRLRPAARKHVPERFFRCLSCEVGGLPRPDAITNVVLEAASKPSPNLLPGHFHQLEIHVLILPREICAPSLWELRDALCTWLGASRGRKHENPDRCGPPPIAVQRPGASPILRQMPSVPIGFPCARDQRADHFSTRLTDAAACGFPHHPFCSSVSSFHPFDAVAFVR